MLTLTLIAPWALGQDPDLITATRLAAEQGDPEAQVSDGVSLGSNPVSNRQFVEVLNYGAFHELGPDWSSQQLNTYLFLRLHKVPKEGTCLPGSHYVCSNHYYLAVRSAEEGFDPVVYDLGEVGEISDMALLMPNQPGTARLRVRVTNFPREYFEIADLPRRERVYVLEVNLDRLTIVQRQRESPYEDN